MKGRSPKPSDVKRLQGNAGKRAKRKVVDEAVDQVADETPAPLPEKNPEEIFFSPGWQPSSWLPDGAKAIWREQLPIVVRETKLQQSGLQVFAAYCDALHRLQKYTGLIEEKGVTYTTSTGFERKRPEVEMRDRASNDVRNLAGELNLTPKSWIGSMGTFAGRQLDMFMHGGRAPQAVQETPSAPIAKGDSLDAFLGAKPTMQ